MSDYKLIYFNFAAVAEPIRLILRHAKVPFEDERINYEDWEKNKPRFPLGQVPILVENGKELTQSAAICRYLGKKFGLLTGDDQLDYRIDQVVEIVTDGRHQWHKLLEFGPNPDLEKIENLKDDLAQNVFPKILKQLSLLVAETEADGDFIIGNKVTYADFILAHWLQLWVNQIRPNMLDDYPILVKQREAVFALPEIKEWLKIRPETLF